MRYLDERTVSAHAREAFAVEPGLSQQSQPGVGLTNLPVVLRALGHEGAQRLGQPLPVLRGTRATLRELRLSDASGLAALLSSDEVSRFISAPPATTEGFSRFILWSLKKRSLGTHFCYGVVPKGQRAAVGLFQLRLSALDAGVADWGFAVGAPYWGTGLFIDAAMEVAAFAFERLGIHRLEGRAVSENGRAFGALRKLGATHERTLHRSFMRNERYYDEALWSLSPASLASGLLTSASSLSFQCEA
jgi:ribosomal-protein-alanine N-acetyltransferase